MGCNVHFITLSYVAHAPTVVWLCTQTVVFAHAPVGCGSINSIGFNNIMTVLSIAIEIMLGSTVLIFIPAIELGSCIYLMHAKQLAV